MGCDGMASKKIRSKSRCKGFESMILDNTHRNRHDLSAHNKRKNSKSRVDKQGYIKNINNISEIQELSSLLELAKKES
jgi:hypothetical protein